MTILLFLTGLGLGFLLGLVAAAIVATALFWWEKHGIATMSSPSSMEAGIVKATWPPYSESITAISHELMFIPNPGLTNLASGSSD